MGFTLIDDWYLTLTLRKKEEKKWIWWIWMEHGNRNYWERKEFI